MTNEALAFENHMVLSTVQAFIGAITASMTAISLEVDARKETVDLYVALSAPPNGTVEELLDDVITDISVLTDDAAYVTVHTWIGDDRVVDGWPGMHKRMVYAAYRRR